MAAKVTMYFKVPCPYCEYAKRFFQERGIAYEAIDLTDKPDEMMKIKQETGWRTVPIILINGKLVGGYSDMKALDEEGKLEPMLNG